MTPQRVEHVHVRLGELFDRTPPHSNEAERALVGGMIVGGAAAVDDAREYLGGGAAFYDERLATIYRAICAVSDQSEGAVDALLLFEHLRDAGTLEDVGGKAELLRLAQETPGAATIRHFARIVSDKAKLRGLIEAAGQAIYEAYNVGDAEGAEEIVARAEERITAVNEECAQYRPIRFSRFQEQHPHLLPPIIDGLLRQGETANIISASKIGKSWLSYGIAMSVVTGQSWLDAFPCTAGRVLLIDNELHPQTIAHRIPKVAEAMGIDAAEYADRLDVLSLRGRGVSIHDLRRYVDRVERGYYQLIIADAWYRFIPPGMNENSNADVMALYNTLDSYAARTGAAWIVVHHSSKGGQGEKAVTDVGAGAGAQSRAADAHLILRQHEEDGCVVLEAAVRSFAPVEPIGLRWTFPLWTRAYALDTAALKGRKTKGEERQDERDAEGMEAIEKALADGPLTVRQIRVQTGLRKERAERLLERLEGEARVEWSEATVRGGKGRLYALSDNPVRNPVHPVRMCGPLPTGPDPVRVPKGGPRTGCRPTRYGPGADGPADAEDDSDIAAAAEAFPRLSLNGHAGGLPT